MSAWWVDIDFHALLMSASSRASFRAIEMQADSDVYQGWRLSTINATSLDGPSGHFRHLPVRQRPYSVENSRSHSNSEDKPPKARSVLGWGTAREALGCCWLFLNFFKNSTDTSDPPDKPYALQMACCLSWINNRGGPRGTLAP